MSADPSASNTTTPSSSIPPNNRRSSTRVPGTISTTSHVQSPPSSPGSNIVSNTMMGPPNPPSRHSRAMTPAELYNAMEQEQEHITNNLLKHIDQLRADKVRIEYELEAESEAVMNRLTRELSILRSRLEQAGLSTQVDPVTAASPGGTGAPTPRSQSRSPSRASSLSRRSLSGANSPRLTAVMGSGSPGMPPSMSQLLPRRDSVEFRGRAPSLNGNGESLPALGVERLIESLKHENGEYKKILRELDDRYRCKQAECERQKEEIATLKLELSIYQRRQSAKDSPVVASESDSAETKSSKNTTDGKESGSSAAEVPADNPT